MEIKEFLKKNWFQMFMIIPAAFFFKFGIDMVLSTMVLFSTFKPIELIQAMSEEWQFIGYCILIYVGFMLGATLFNIGIKLFRIKPIFISEKPKTERDESEE